jgi:hypothetical protein
MYGQASTLGGAAPMLTLKANNNATGDVRLEVGLDSSGNKIWFNSVETGTGAGGYQWATDGTVGLELSSARALTVGADATNQTHLLNGLFTARGYSSGGSIKHLFQNRDAANSSGGSAYVKIDSFTSDAGLILATSAGTERWTIFTNPSNAPTNGLVFAQASLGNVGYIASSGDWYIGNTSLALVNTVASNRAAATTGTSPLAVVSSGSASGQYFIECFYSTSTSAGGLQRNASTQAVQLFNTSDRRVKKDFEEYEGQLDKLCRVQLKRFNFKNDPDAHGYGPIAQELALIYPEKINPTDDGEGDDLPEGGKAWSIGNDWSYELIKSVQELKAKNDALEARLSALENAP